MWKYGFLGFSCYFCIMLSKSQNKMNTDFTKDSIESAYCFFHQKLRVYEYSTSPTQRDDIEYAISQYVDGMNPALYQLLASGAPRYLVGRTAGGQDMRGAVELLDSMVRSGWMLVG